MTTDKLAAIYKALANENRLEIFLQIMKAERKSYPNACDCFVSDVIGKLGIGAPTVSHHLKELTRAGLIETEMDGKFLVARVNREILAEVRAILDVEAKG